jgi:hypothetical protein
VLVDDVLVDDELVDVVDDSGQQHFLLLEQVGGQVVVVALSSSPSPSPSPAANPVMDSRPPTREYIFMKSKVIGLVRTNAPAGGTLPAHRQHPPDIPLGNPHSPSNL